MLKLQLNQSTSVEEFKLIDDRPTPDEDSYETPPKLFKRLEKQYGMNFQLDAFARDYNTLCKYYLADAFANDFLVKGIPVDTWVNGPHSENENCIRRCDAQHRKFNMNIVQIVPTNVESSKVWHELIENETECFVENHPIDGRPAFRKHGRKTKHASRNAYRVIIWRKNSSKSSSKSGLSCQI